MISTKLSPPLSPPCPLPVHVLLLRAVNVTDNYRPILICELIWAVYILYGSTVKCIPRYM